MIDPVSVLHGARYYLSLINADVARGYLTLPHKSVDGVDPLGAAMDWIRRAQDAFDDGGVARSYALAYHPYFKRRGWVHSYPETTGYIIPTVFDYAHQTGKQEFFERAVRMADWECDVQLADGAVQGGTVNQPPAPAIFNTGQVIFGWVRAFQETGADRYLAAAVRAGDYLLATQDADGAWRKTLSQHARAMPFYTYNTRTAWALIVLGEASGNPAYREAAVRNVEHAVGGQLENGWLPNNCLWDPARPLLHTIAYSLRGILEAGVALNNPVYVAAARKGADAILATQRDDGSLAGRFDRRWRPTVQYSCLTGNAQMGLVWGRLYQTTLEERYARALAHATGFLRRVQWLGTGNPGLDGGVSGSYPLHGRYGRFEVLSWAVKFLADALMLETSLGLERSPAHSSGARDALR